MPLVLCTRLLGRQGRTSRRPNKRQLCRIATCVTFSLGKGDFIPGGVHFSLHLVHIIVQAVGVNVDKLTLCTTNVRRSIGQDVRKCFSPEAPLIAHFDGNLLPDCSGANAHHMPIVVLGKNVEKLLAILGQEVAVVEEFVYLGSLVQSTTQSSPDISCRTVITRAAIQNLDNQIWKSRIAISTKLKLYITCILPIFLYGSECWAVTKRDVLRRRRL